MAAADGKTTIRFNTQPPEGGCSGHRSRCIRRSGFNTQPPEGGCSDGWRGAGTGRGFNTQPPEGGCVMLRRSGAPVCVFQHTATRRWLPGSNATFGQIALFQHTATRRWLRNLPLREAVKLIVSTHSHPKVAAGYTHARRIYRGVSTHSHPKVAAYSSRLPPTATAFQHTATRRWLPRVPVPNTQRRAVSTHSHPKVAAHTLPPARSLQGVSTHSHPKVAACAQRS